MKIGFLSMPRVVSGMNNNSDVRIIGKYVKSANVMQTYSSLRLMFHKIHDLNFIDKFLINLKSILFAAIIYTICSHITSWEECCLFQCWVHKNISYVCTSLIHSKYSNFRRSRSCEIFTSRFGSYHANWYKAFRGWAISSRRPAALRHSKQGDCVLPHKLQCILTMLRM